MKKKTILLLATLLITATSLAEVTQKNNYVRVSGPDLIQPNGQKLYIQGTNLGNWLNPEGYMFGFSRTNSAWMIDLLFKQAVGPDFTAKFWQTFKENYITRSPAMIFCLSNNKAPTPSVCHSTINCLPMRIIWDSRHNRMVLSVSTMW